MSDKLKSWRDVFAVHPAADLFPMMSADELRALGEDIKAHGLTSPIMWWRPKANNDLEYQPKDGDLLLDGRNRLDAIEAAGLSITKTISEHWHFVYEDRSGLSLIDGKSHRERVDPYAFVLSANVHRRHLTAAQRVELVEKVLKANPSMSSRRAAKLVGVSPTTALKVRDELVATGDVPKMDTSIDTKGRKQPAHHAAREKPAPAVEPITDADYSDETYRNVASDFTRAAENLLSMSPVRMFAALSEVRQQRLTTALLALAEWPTGSQQ